ncbi:hypothetical protein GS439_06750 [Rhodococcus hoagii]|nr:hypothetical protein [Prescottella equi]
MRNPAWTLAQENWAQAIAEEIRRRIDNGIFSSADPVVVMVGGGHSFDPDLLTEKQLEKYLDEVEYGADPDLPWFGALFGVKDPHA